MSGTKSHWTKRMRNPQKMYLVILVFASLSVLQGYAESISRMQNSKPSEFNDITPSPQADWTMSTNGWRPMISSSVAPAEPTVTEEEPPAGTSAKRPRVPSASGPPKGHMMASRPPPPNAFLALPMQSHHPTIDLSTYVEDGEDTLRTRPRRQKKRPHFKTVDHGSSLGIISSSSSDQLLSFRGTNPDTAYIRHVVVTEPSFPRLRPHPSSLRVAASPPHGLFQADLPQEMLPPTTAPHSSRTPVTFDGPHSRGRPIPQQQQQHQHHSQFHGPSFYFQAPPPPSSTTNHQHHHHMHPQTPPPPHAYPAVARPSDPLPGSLLRPHKDRLTDSSAFRTGGIGFQVRPAPVPWPDSLVDGRIHYSVTSTPLVEERPSPWDGAVGGRQEGIMGEKPVASIGLPQRAQESLESVKERPKPQRDSAHSQYHVTKTLDETNLWSGVGGGSADLHGPTKDPSDGATLKTTGIDSSQHPTRPSKKPFRSNGDRGRKRVQQGTVDSVHEGMLRPHDNQDQGSMVLPEIPREERPRPSKHRNNPHHRKKTDSGEPTHSTKTETAVDHQVPVVPQLKPTTSEEVIKSVRGENGGQRGPGTRKRRPKPPGHRQSLQNNKPLDVQEVHQQQYQEEQYQVQQYQQQQNIQRHPPQEAVADQYRPQVFDQEAQPQQHDVVEPHRQQQEPVHHPEQQQPPEGQRPRKRGRRPSRIRKPSSDTRTRVEGENQLAPTGVRSAEEQQIKWTAEARPRPIVRNRRPKPEAQSTAEPDHHAVTAPASEGEREYSTPSVTKKARPTAVIHEEIPSDESRKTDTAYRVKESEEDRFIEEETPEHHNPVQNQHQLEGIVSEQPTAIPQRHEDSNPTHETVNIPSTAAAYVETTVKEVEEERVPTTVSTRIRPQRLPEPSTTAEVTTTAETPTTTLKPTSSAYGIRSRIRTGSRPRFSVKDYRERLNRLSQLSGRGKNGSEEGGGEIEGNVNKEAATGVGTTGPGRERWFPGRRQQQTLQEQQQLQHQRLQSSATRNDGQEPKEEKPKFESVRERYRARPPALRQRPTAAAEVDTSKGPTGTGSDKQEETTTAPSSINRYKSRYGGRFSTTPSTSNSEVTTTENPTSRRKGILTTYGMRRPIPLRIRSGVTTTTEAAVETTTTPVTTTTTASYEEMTTTVTSTTEILTTTVATTPAPLSTTTEEVQAPRVVENEVTVQESEVEGSEEVEEDGVDLKDGFLRQGQLVNVGGPVSLSVLTESEEESGEEDEISPEQRVSDLTVWATTGQSGGNKGSGRGEGGGLVTFSAVSSYPVAPFVPRLVTMATEDPVLPLEAFFFGPSTSGGRKSPRAR